MSAYAGLVLEGKRACDALAASTPWSRHDWAKAFRALDRAGALAEVSLTSLVREVARTGARPQDAVAVLLEVRAGLAAAPH